MKVKICGMKEALNISNISNLKPDLMGFIFYGPSPRNVVLENMEVENNTDSDDSNFKLSKYSLLSTFLVL